MRALVFIVVVLALLGCKGKPPATIKAADLRLSCTEVRARIETHTAEVNRLQAKQKNAFSTKSYVGEGAKMVAQNPIVGLGALILYPFIAERFTAEDEADLEHALAEQAYFTRVTAAKNCPAQKKRKGSSGLGNLLQLGNLFN